jgi:NUMOD1 domain
MAEPKAVWAYRQKTGVFVRKYNSISEAARKINSHPSNVLHAVSDGIAVKGYYWLLAEGKRPLKVPQKSERFNPRSKPINIYKKGKFFAVFQSTKDAAEVIALNAHTIRQLCLDKNKNSGDFSAEYVNPKDKNRVKNHGGGYRKPVAVIAKTSKGKIVGRFNSIGEASEKLKVRNISLCLQGRIKQAGGYFWEKAK